MTQPPANEPRENLSIKRLTLNKGVTITGLSPLASRLHTKPQSIEMRPLLLSDAKRTSSNNGMGWYWETSDGTLVPIDMSIVREGRAVGSSAIKLHPCHYLYFQHRNRNGVELLNCVEHILALKTLGLDGVVIKALHNSTWVPYDGRAKMYWEAIEGHTKYDGHLMPMTMQVQHTHAYIDPRVGWSRSLTMDSMHGRHALAVNVTVNYPMFGGEEVIERHFPVDDPSKMLDVLCSRPLLQPPWLESMLPGIKLLGWPHAKNVLKRSEFNKKDSKPFLGEIARHRMLDVMGAMALLAESGTYVAGCIVTGRGNHALDLGFLERLKPIAHQMYPDLESLAPEPSPSAPSRLFLWHPMARKSATHDNPGL